MYSLHTKTGSASSERKQFLVGIQENTEAFGN
jgi:hypothetical protein